MTERQREDDFLDRLLDEYNAQPAPPLTPSDERALLNAAYRAGTPPLIAAPLPAVRLNQETPQPETALVVRTPVPEKTFAQRHPFLLMVLGIGIGIILGRRRR